MTMTTTTTMLPHESNRPDHYHIFSWDDGVRLVQMLAPCFAVSTAIKIMLFPAYFSTDLLVHRHWKAVVRHLPADQWYWDDQHISTRHTVDYPPGFLLYGEMVWSCYYARGLEAVGWLRDSSCLALQSDGALEATVAVGTKYAQVANLSSECVAFLRSTVILSDIFYWVAAWLVARAATAAAETAREISRTNHRCPRLGLTSMSRSCWTTFFALVCHPALLWLDHVHFQYNSALLAFLLLAVACLLYDVTCRDRQRSWLLLVAAGSFATLLTCKHLYILLAPWFGIYLFRRYCFVKNYQDASDPSKQQSMRQPVSFSWTRLITLATVTVIALVLPFLPVFWAAARSNLQPFQAHATMSQRWVVLMRQIMQRLFPFGRGLVHDYWAGNVWAWYTALQKLSAFVIGQQSVLPAISPHQCLMIVVCILLPSTLCAWHAAAHGCPRAMLLSLAHASAATFLTAYHVHEKAIVTALLLLTVLVTSGLAVAPIPNENINNIQSKRKICDHQDLSASATDDASPPTTTGTKTQGDDDYSHLDSSKYADDQPNHANCLNMNLAWYLLWEWTAWGTLGCLPLLFRPQEFLLKAVTWVAYLTWLVTVANHAVGVHFADVVISDTDDLSSGKARSAPWRHTWLDALLLPRTSTAVTRWHRQSLAIMVLVIVQGDILAPLKIYGRWEFAPLAVTSLSCACGMMMAMIRLTYILILTLRNMRMRPTS